MLWGGMGGEYQKWTGEYVSCKLYIHIITVSGGNDKSVIDVK